MSPTDARSPRCRVPTTSRPCGVRPAKSFGEHEVLRGIDFEVRRGEVVVLIGPSGSGKTTVLRSLNGLETPDAGILTPTGRRCLDFAEPVPLGSRCSRCATAAPWCSSTTTCSRT